MNNKISVDITTIHSKKKDRDYTCVKLSIGDWSTLFFPRTSFELDYIKSVLESQ